MASELSMNGRKKIETLQEDFNEKFEYLNLTFFDYTGIEIPKDKTLSEIRKSKGEDISIIASLKISTLEKKFEEEIGVKVEVSYKKGGQILHTINQNQLTLNELNEWCAQNGCEKFETKPSSRGTKSEVKENKAKVGDDAALQHELFNAIKQLYPEADAKKIGEDNHLDIFISRIYPKRGAHLFFNTAKDDIKVGFYCRDEEFVLKVLSNSSNIESYANGIRILNNPEFSDAITAVAAANFFITDILSAINDTEQESKPVKEPLPPTLKPEPKAEQKITPKPAQKKQISEDKNDENEEVDLLAGMNKANPKPSPSPKVSKATQVESEEEEIEEQIEENDEEEIEEASAANEKSELSSLLSKINKEPEVEEDEIQEESKEEEIEEELEENEAEESEIEETPDAENKTDLSSLLSKLNIPTSNKSKDVELDQEEVEEKETPKEKPVAKPTPVVKKAILSNFDITDKPTINKLCERIKQEKILPHLPYINTALEKENYSVDNHVANFFLSKVYISDQNMEGFLYVNMDGFHSNCIDKGEMQPIFSWSGVKDIKYSEDGNNAKIDLVAEQGELTIRAEGSHALKILHHIYLYAWKEANDKFANESIIIWNVVEEMGIKLNSYPTQEAYIQ
jgi:hypothetical protein